MLAPIPKQALIDTVAHKVMTQGTRGKTYSSATISNVLVQDKVVRQNINGNTLVVSNALMFWDARHSTSATFNIGDKITYNGVDKFIVDVVYAKTTEGIHHVELMLL